MVNFRYFIVMSFVVLLSFGGCKNKGAKVVALVDNLIQNPNDTRLLHKLTTLATEGDEVQRYQTLKFLLEFARNRPENMEKYLPIVRINLNDNNPLIRRGAMECLYQAAGNQTAGMTPDVLEMMEKYPNADTFRYCLHYLDAVRGDICEYRERLKDISQMQTLSDGNKKSLQILLEKVNRENLCQR